MNFVLLVAGVGFAGACSNIMIPGGSSMDGSTMIAYSADSGNLMGDLSHWPASSHAPGTLREIYSWDFGTKLGAIPEVAETYNVVGNTNEFQLTIGETTFGGLEELCPQQGKEVCSDSGCIDYGQLIWTTLSRAKTAQEAITVMDDLMQTYGYASEGESFSIADTKEVWLMEVIGKGTYARGSVWVATRIPDGYVCAHANQARTRTFPRNDPNVRYAADVVSFARAIGVYSGDDQDFSFSDVYDPVSVSGARFCEARVFSFFSAVATPGECMEQYLDYVRGYNLTNRMPLFIKPAAKLSVNDTIWHMRNHYEGTWLDPSGDVGAQAWNLPNRLGEGLTWNFEGATYANERPIGTQYAAWNFVGVQRPHSNFSVLWFGADDSTFSLHAPFYGVTSQVPPAWSGGNCTGRDACKAALGLPGTIKSFTMDSQHWVQNLIANYAYSRYNQVAPAVHAKLVDLEAKSFDDVQAMDAKLAKMDHASAVAAASQFSYSTANSLHQQWQAFFGTLFSTYVDGYKAEPDPSNQCTGMKKVTPHTSTAWRQKIVSETGDHYKIPDNVKLQAKRSAGKNKLSLRALGGFATDSEAHGAADTEKPQSPKTAVV